MARKLKTRITTKQAKKEAEKNTDVHMLLFSVYKAANLLLTKFKLHRQLGINRHNQDKLLEIQNIKIKSMEHYPILAEFKGIKSLTEQITRAMFLFHKKEMREKYSLDSKIYKTNELHAIYYGLRKITDEHYKEKWKNDLPCADEEVADALETLKDIIVNFKIVQIFSDKNLDIDRNVRKYIRTMITKFNNSFLPYVTEIIESGS